MRRSLSALFALPLAAACAGSGSSESAGPAVLRYDMAGGESLVYASADTGTVTIDIGGQVMEMGILSNQTMTMDFVGSADGVEVTATWTDLDASMSNPMQGTQRISEEDISAPLVFTLGALGAGDVVSAPEVPQGMGQLFDPQATARTFFPRLPGQPPEAGLSWVDTVTVESSEAGMEAETRSIITYTVATDTVVDGRTLLKINTVSRDRLYVEGEQQGMSIMQDLSGRGRGHILWDLAEGVMYSRYTESDLDGTMDVDQVPYPLDVSVEGVSYTKLVTN